MHVSLTIDCYAREKLYLQLLVDAWIGENVFASVARRSNTDAAAAPIFEQPSWKDTGCNQTTTTVEFLQINTISGSTDVFC
jgi:hypothetical protein